MGKDIADWHLAEFFQADGQAIEFLERCRFAAADSKGPVRRRSDPFMDESRAMEPRPDFDTKLRLQNHRGVACWKPLGGDTRHG